jgi:hypothetical protein
VNSEITDNADVILALLLLLWLLSGLRTRLPAWGFMWLTALALYAGCKWLTYRQAAAGAASVDRRRAAGYLFLWPGMDAKLFLDPRVVPARSHPFHWMIAWMNTLLGMVLIGRIVRMALPAHPLFAGWIGMTGVVFLLHFGLFHLLSLGWRRLGIAATPLMRSPALAGSVNDFWTRRWNTAYHQLAFRFAFRPLRRLVPPSTALVLTFMASGLVHELVISLPSQGGYGLPTLYFLVQALGALAERTDRGRRLGLGCGVRGRLFTLAVTACPAFWLFPPTFIRTVILPMLRAVGAT